MLFTHIHSWMGRGVINKPLETVAAFMKDIQSSFVWDSFLVVSINSMKKHAPKLCCLLTGGPLCENTTRQH